MKYVYVVELGCYSSRGVGGVYVSAMAEHPIRADYKYPDVPTAGNASRRGGWQPSAYGEPGYEWNNGLDWDDAATITRYELQGELPEGVNDDSKRPDSPMGSPEAAKGPDERLPT